MKKVLVIVVLLMCIVQSVAYASSGEWKQTNGRWWYQYSDGSYPKSEWVQIGGKWYHFDSAGWMEQGWIFTGGYYYHLSENGNMTNHRFSDANANYAFRDSGELIETSLRVNRESQQQSNWCWAASSAVVGKYKTNTGITQTQIVNYVKGSTVNEGGSRDDQKKAVEYASNYEKTARISGVFDFETIRGKIDSQKPFIMNIKWLSEKNGVVGWIEN